MRAIFTYALRHRENPDVFTMGPAFNSKPKALEGAHKVAREKSSKYDRVIVLTTEFVWQRSIDMPEPKAHKRSPKKG